jgi:DNA mismatch repair protein MutS2
MNDTMLDAARLLELDRILQVCSKEAASDPGRRRILTTAPLDDAQIIRRELTLVEEMRRLLEHSTFPLGDLQDITAALHRVAPQGAMLNRDEYLPLLDVLRAAAAVKKLFSRGNPSYAALAEPAQELGDFRDLIAEMERIFDASGEIRDTASPELKRLRRQKEAEIRRQRDVLENVLKKWSAQKYTQEDAPTYREGRLLIPVKAEYRGRISGVVQDESASGATLFVEPLEAIAIGNAIRKLAAEEQREIHRLLAQLCDAVRARLTEIHAAFEILVRYDVILAKARLARKLVCIPPEVTEQPLIRLVCARHPLLALRADAAVVPLDLTLGGEDGGILVITGPNAGGKTVALKTVGLLCLMTACGMQIPAEEGTQIPVLRSLHCDIGDPQSVEQDLSTFTSHLLRLKAALADERHPKLVLLDEIGVGTDPAEGSALARAALLVLQRQGALGVVTTHQGTLKAFAHETPGIFNGSMEFDQTTLRPTFRFRPGVPGSSYALEISARVGLPEDLLQLARRFLGEERHQLEDLLARLNESLRRSESARRRAESKAIEMEGLRKLYRERLDHLTRTEKERLARAAREAKEILRNANKMIEAQVKAIREQQASRGVIAAAHRAVREEKEKIAAILADTSSKKSASETGRQKSRTGTGKDAASVQGALRVGDWVRLDELRDPVQITAVKKDGKEVMLEVGGLHLWIEVSRLTPVPPPESARAGSEVKVSLTAPPAGAYQLDLRGMTGDEAAFAVEKYLSDCSVSGWKSVRIIHGKGTGALRKRVWEILAQYPGVKSFRYGRPEEGEFGATIVELE